MSSQISLAIVDAQTKTFQDVAAALKSFDEDINIVAKASDLDEAMKIIPTANPQILILEVTDIEQGVKQTAFIASRFPKTTTVVTAADKNPDWILRLIRAGATEYLIKPLDSTDLVEALRKVTRIHAQRNGVQSRKGSVISAYNPSGGMGTTTIAVNLAATLAAQGKGVALVDFNFCNADVTAFLSLSPRYTLTSITGKKGQIDSGYVKSILIRHSSGIQVLSGPVEPRGADKMVPEQLQEVIVLLQTMFDYIVIDTSGHLPGCNLAIFEYSDHVLFNTVLNLPAIRNAKRYLAALDYEGVGPDRLKLVINRHISRDEIKVADAEKVLRTTACQVVPNAYSDVNSSICKGMPLVSCYPRSPVTKAMNELATRLTTSPTTQKASGEKRKWPFTNTAA